MARARPIDSIVVWALSVLLAAVFLVAGLTKLLSLDLPWLQAVAMHGFPRWVRVIVGSIEVVAAIGLLVPPLATLAAVVLALMMLPATAAQYVSGESWGIWVPILAMALLLVIAWRRNAALVHDRVRTYAADPHPLLRDGIIAGFLGAATIAVWFFIIDSLAGRPLFTPTVLGRGLLGVFGPISEQDDVTLFVATYTLFHFVAFMLLGLGVALVVAAAQREPSILFAFIILFVATEVGIYGLVELLDLASPLGQHAWLQIMAGNLLAAVVMGTFFWRRHAGLRERFRHSLDWEATGARGGRPMAPSTGGR